MSMITIEVVYADGPDRQRTVELVLAPGTTVAACLERVAALRGFSGVAVSDLGRGVFGQVVDDAYALRSGDRLELYRPLIVDAKTARRLRAAQKPG